MGEPYKGCSSMTDPEAVKHRIVVMERGECMFIDKVRLHDQGLFVFVSLHYFKHRPCFPPQVRNAQKAGAVGVIVIGENT